MQTARAKTDEVRSGAPLDNGDVDARQRELGRQHQPGRPAPGNYYRMFGHRHPPAATSARICMASSFSDWTLASGPYIVNNTQIAFRILKRLYDTASVLPQAPWRTIYLK